MRFAAAVLTALCLAGAATNAPGTCTEGTASADIGGDLSCIGASAAPDPKSGSVADQMFVYSAVRRIEPDPAVTRGPYLQKATPDSLVVLWRTDSPTQGRVSYGLAPGALIATQDEATISVDHSVTLSGLEPNKKYYYSVDTPSQILAGGDIEHHFTTPPAIGSAQAFRVWVLGDSGTANADALSVAESFYRYTGTRDVNFWLMLGDNAYNSGTDDEYQRAVFDTYPAMLRKSVLWPTLGNHDGLSADSLTLSGPYYDIFDLPANAEAGGEPSGTEAYYSFDYANAHFISLNSHDADRSTDGAMLTWLQQDLASTSQQWVIAFWHHPPYTKGSHDSDLESALIEMRQNALPILEAGGVDLVLAGHSHSYERSVLIDGHYGASATFDESVQVDGGDGRIDSSGAYKAIFDEADPYRGAVYAVAGSSGKVGGGTLDHPAMLVSLSTLGSLVIDVAGNRLDATFIDAGGVAQDNFSIHKSPDNCPLLANPDQTDTDGDGAGDACDPDDDGDGLPDELEPALGVDPLKKDTDADGIDDDDEDSDGDGAGNLAELMLQTDPVDPLSKPTRSFDDVSFQTAYFAPIEILARLDIVEGCSANRFCPNQVADRASAALLLSRVLWGVDHSPPAATGMVFVDVKADSFAAGYIEELSALGVTYGCTSDQYCPQMPVTKLQMAILLWRAKHGPGSDPSAATGMVYSDVDQNQFGSDYIEGITTWGDMADCASMAFCPNQAVTRAQLAALLVENFALSLP